MSTTTDGRSTRWDEHRARRREELVDATLRAIRQHGAAVGMDDIATAAGTSKTVFYRHFTDRNGLYAAVAARVDALILRDVTTALGSAELGSEHVGSEHGESEHGGSDQLDTAGGSPRRLIAAAIDSYLRLVERDPEVYRFIVNAPLLDRPAGGDPAGQVTSHIAAQMSAVVHTALEAAGRDTTAAVVWGPGLVGMVRAAADQWLAAPDPMPREALAEHLTDLAWGGLSSAWPTTPS